MSVNAVTFRQRGGLTFTRPLPTHFKFVARPQFGPFRPVALYVKPFRDLRTVGNRAITPRAPAFKPGFVGRIVTPYGQAAARQVERKALRKLAAKLLFKKALGIAGEIVPTLAQNIWQAQIDPPGFPGWGNFPASWTSNGGTIYPGKEIGTLTVNGFDQGPWSSVVHNLIDLSDGDIFGFRYWGHFHGSNPFSTGFRPGDDWAFETQGLANPAAQTTAQARVRYRTHTETATAVQTQPWGPRQNVAIGIGTSNRDPIDIAHNVPRVRDRGDKAKPKNIFVYLVIKRFANAGGEIKEWTDILAEASGYIKGSMMLPEHLRDTGKETQAKLYWLFVVTGINSLDWPLLAELIVENEIEDLIYGFAGQLSKAAARSLGMTVGPQTGLVM